MSETSYRYRLYDMVVESAQPLALSDASDGELDDAGRTWAVEEAPVDVGEGRLVHDVADFDGERRLKVWVDGDERVWFSHGNTRIEWDGGRRRIRWQAGEDMETRPGIALERMAAPIACMLAREDWIALHASAVGDGDGNAWIFIGNSGAGKSTTAIELTRRGMSLLADDLVLLDVSTGRLVTATPAVRLFDRPGEVPEATDRELVMPEIEKYWYRLPEKVGDGRVRATVRGVFSLEPGEAVEDAAIEAVTGRAATVRLLAQTFDLTEASAKWKEARFRSVCRFARAVDVCSVAYPHSGRERPAQVEAIREYLGEPDKQVIP